MDISTFSTYIFKHNAHVVGHHFLMYIFIYTKPTRTYHVIPQCPSIWHMESYICDHMNVSQKHDDIPEMVMIKWNPTGYVHEFVFLFGVTLKGMWKWKDTWKIYKKKNIQTSMIHICVCRQFFGWHRIPFTRYGEKLFWWSHKKKDDQMNGTHIHREMEKKCSGKSL